MPVMVGMVVSASYVKSIVLWAVLMGEMGGLVAAPTFAATLH